MVDFLQNELYEGNVMLGSFIYGVCKERKKWSQNSGQFWKWLRIGTVLGREGRFLSLVNVHMCIKHISFFPEYVEISYLTFFLSFNCNTASLRPIIFVVL